MKTLVSTSSNFGLLLTLKEDSWGDFQPQEQVDNKSLILYHMSFHESRKIR